ncbi:AAA family ATPase [Cardiobacterium valvarum]|uniref:Recombination protein F n=1 Tax=Cardiobacterium valvarum TaxID=194702 RepID=A0A381E889_9GAMM|nr:AAA family ATPase [Cardiobacterium valvarum]SUX22934.1 recombination protein F [Cardiobacterium valvarum]
MHISLLSLQDFRGFRELSLPLHPKLNIVYGVNGTGKSTILDATAILLSWLASRIRMHNGKGKFPTESEIHNDALLTQLSLTLGCKNKQTHWQIVKRRRGRNIRDAKVSRTSLVFLSNLAQEIRGSNFAEGEVLSLPVFAHYSVHRAVLCPKAKHGGWNFLAPFSADVYALPGDADFPAFLAWLSGPECLGEENQRRNSRSAGKKSSVVKESSKRSSSFFRALSLVMPDHDLPVPPQGADGEDDFRLAFEQLSEGDKCLVALVGDMALRLTAANPQSEDPLLGEGIFLIDEVDLHLHPYQQQTVVPGLLAAFPHCQFLISTNSPLVLGSAKGGLCFCLDEGSDAPHNIVPLEMPYGKNVDRVLQDQMGLATTRPPLVAELLTRIYQDIERKAYTSAQFRIDALERLIGNDPELCWVRQLIKRCELLGK